MGKLLTFFTKRNTKSAFARFNDHSVAFSNTENKKEGMIYSNASPRRVVFFVCRILFFSFDVTERKYDWCTKENPKNHTKQSLLEDSIIIDSDRVLLEDVQL